MGKIIVAGGVAFDWIMSMPAKFKDQLMPDKLHILNVSFNVDQLRKSYGGTAANQAYNLALFGFKPVLVSGVGKDFSEYRQWLEKSGVDMSGLRESKSDLTASAFAVTDEDDNQIWSFYLGALAEASKIKLESLASLGDWLIINPGNHQAMEQYIDEVKKLKLRLVFDPAFKIPKISKESLIKGIDRAEVLVGNDYEITLLLRKTGLTKSRFLKDNKILITTLGAKGSLIEQGGKKHRIPPAKPKNTCDPTGAGDAYRAGFMAGYLKGFSLPVCGRMGATTAVYTVEKYGTQTHRFSLSQFKKRYKENFGESLDL